MFSVSLIGTAPVRLRGCPRCSGALCLGCYEPHCITCGFYQYIVSDAIWAEVEANVGKKGVRMYGGFRWLPEAQAV